MNYKIDTYLRQSLDGNYWLFRRWLRDSHRDEETASYSFVSQRRLSDGFLQLISDLTKNLSETKKKKIFYYRSDNKILVKRIDDITYTEIDIENYINDLIFGDEKQKLIDYLLFHNISLSFNMLHSLPTKLLYTFDLDILYDMAITIEKDEKVKSDEYKKIIETLKNQIQ